MGGFTLFVFLTIFYICNAQDCVDTSDLCSSRTGLCDSIVGLQKLCPKSCGLCKDKLYKLTYFDLRARGEQIRWILEQGDANWEDIRIKQEDWPAIKPTTLTGQIPYLEVDGVTIAQSGAIAMYLARELGLSGANDLEAAEVHMVWETVQETFNSAGRAFVEQDPAKKQVKLKEYDDVSFPRLMKFLEERLENGEEWLVGKQMTIADIVVASFMDSQVWPKPLADLKASKTVSNLTSKVTSLPKIKQWIATRPVTDY